MPKTLPKKEKEATGKPEPARSAGPGSGTRICHSDKEFEEMFLPAALEKKKIQERIREPEKLKEHFLKKIRK